MIAALCNITFANAADLKDFGSLPVITSMAVSPDGSRFAWVQNIDSKALMVVYDTKTKTLKSGARLSDDIKARDIQFATNNHVILKASETRHILGYRGRLEYSGAFAYNIDKEKIVQLFQEPDGIHERWSETSGFYRAQSGLGKVVGVDSEKGYAFMPALDDSYPPSRNLYRVSLSNGRPRLLSNGHTDTMDWYVNQKGEVLAREDFDPEKKQHIFYSYLSGKAKEIYRYETALPSISVQAVAWDEKALLFIGKHNDSEGIYSLSLVDGTISGPLFEKTGKEIDYLITDINRKLLAVKYSGFLPEYQFQNSDLNAVFEELVASYPGSSVHLLDMDKRQENMVILVGGNIKPHSYQMFNSKNNTLASLTSGYPNIKADDLGEVIAFRYSARDDEKIPAVLTWPANSSKGATRKGLPMIVMPHGGPDSYDRVDFDWLAQYLAHLGYLVLQPNFRGSTGFGRDFHQAGKMGWGQIMQDDITDGVTYLAEKGIVDKDRVCILGASYGGYAALIGGALTPDLYRCVIAINGLSDIGKELNQDRFDLLDPHSVENYWATVFGDDDQFKQRMDAASPINHVDNYAAPVMILYSRDDTVVRPRQSIIMHNALIKADKDSTLVELAGEDHWFSTSDMRIKTLNELERFLAKNNPLD
ncbi:alpha/beta hydrolase family protein [Halioxenophilus sp. WMMB6]|uniref:alpha/beta hydrolase family protein n=1 Tax=Halioxenophilus sp. WMMB6 TaxID=3073815 RepID=UPI00295EE379|nr:prolyl oligopeptidase family serine peptidase [Halioxenophilus sp. WMMB6]